MQWFADTFGWACIELKKFELTLKNWENYPDLFCFVF